MTEATGCCLSAMTHTSGLKFVFLYSFPLIVSSVFLCGVKAVRDLIGMSLAHSLVCLALRSQHNDRMQAAGSLGQGLLAFGVQW